MFQQSSSYLSLASANPYSDTLDEDIIASRQALQSTARAISAESSSRLATMARHSPEHAMLAPSNRYEHHQSALISAAGLPRSAYSSPNTPFCQQQNTSMAYEQASVPATTMSSSSYFPNYQQAQYSPGEPMLSDHMYPAVSHQLSPYDQYAMTQEGYYDAYLPTSMSMAYAQQQGVEMLSSVFGDTPPPHAHLSLPAMDNNTAFSTPDMPSNQQFPEPKTPPPPASSNSSCEGVRDDDDLVGVGLYDEPLSTSYWEEPSPSDSVDPILYPNPIMRKGLKLEETLDPSTLTCGDMDADGDDEEEEQKDKPSKDMDVTSGHHGSDAAGLNALNDGRLFPVDDGESYGAHVAWTAAPSVMLNSFAAFPGSYQNYSY
ncbi:hypothetical protein FQN49_001796 [Arthroderma sp. PD_2]|nr:hypothetical protein FQN49_001796 [Arthroderma sp. PD_2]